MSALRDVDIRHLAALAAVVDEGSFAKAAAALGFTQSAVSQQIAALEKAAGLPVLDRPRGPKAAELTPAGELLLEYAREVLARVEEMDDELDRLRRGITGRLVIGTFQSVSGKLLPTIIGRMRAEVPDVDIRLFETDDQTALLRGVLDDELDLAFTVDPEGAGTESRFLGFDPFVVIAAAGELPGPTASHADLNGHPMIGQPADNVCQRLIDRRLDQAGVVPDYVFRSADNGAVQGMVRSGMGRSVAPYLAVDPDDPGIDVLELDPPVTPRSIHLTRRAGRTLPPAADTFADISAEIGADVLQPDNTLVD
ncbi:MAG: LysR family transcriptional regulator [Acidimicrobiales bacterium]|nr:LysR family transcriptional regulator [Acidimicrobiales bacterium]